MRQHDYFSPSPRLWQPVLKSLFIAALFAWSHSHASNSVAEGQTLATKGSGAILACVTCHGAQGEGMATFPYLAGQGQAYLERQLDNFAAETRKNPIMVPIAKAMSSEQKQAVSAYFAQLKPAIDKASLQRSVDTYPAKGDAGAWLANRGDWGNNLPACIQCHGPGGVGVGPDFPSIAGLPATYLVEQLQAWKSVQRNPGPQNLMRDISNRMSDEQIKAVSTYYANLPKQTSSGANK